jgi:hypothetical protein
MKNKKYYLIGLLLVVLLTAGVLFGSKNAQPGNSLYSVRINILEKVTGLSKSGDYEKGTYAIALGEERLKELKALKENKNLDSVTGNNVRDNFNQQTITIQNAINNLTQKDGINSKQVLGLAEVLDVQIEQAKAIFNIDQLEVLDEGVPLPKATSTKAKK